MELFSAEAETLQKIVQEWTQHSERELEATFGFKGQVDTTRFLTVAKRLKAKGYTALPQEDRLTIMTTNHTRFTLMGMGVIQQYCRDNRLAGKPFVAMIKDKASQESNLDLDDYETRIKVRKEVPLSADDSRVKELLATWGQQKKAFRLIRRWTFQGHGVLYDLSIVRSTKSDLKGNYIWARNFQDQNLLGQPPIYEIEVELKREPATETSEKAMSTLIKGVGEVLRGLQKHTILIRRATKDKVLNGYKTLVGDEKFRGVAPITLELKNMTKEKEEGVPNLRNGYNVTDKADGLRVHAYCDSKGELFMIDMAMNVYRTGLRKESCKDTLLDGEWVTQNKHEEAVQQLLLFDIYIGLEKKKVEERPFYSFEETSDTRHNALTSWVNEWNKDNGPKILVAGITPMTKLQVSPKTFLFATKDTDRIFNLSSQILDSPKIYNTDGLIFTPNDSPLPSKAGVAFLEQFKWKPSHDNTIDFLVMTQKKSDSPKEDDVVTAIKPETGTTIQYKTLRLYVGSSTDPAYDNPRDTILFERPLPGPMGGRGKTKKGEYKPVPFNPKEVPDTMASICYREMMVDPDTNEEFIMTERSMEPIQDKSIVEMRYDPSQPPGWRWIPIRVRYDKTERLLRGILGRTLNSEMVAESVWNSIHEPITETMIRTGAEEPSEEDMATIAKMEREREGVARRYTERKAPLKDQMRVRGLRDFHNKYIKESVLLSPVLKGGNRTVLDIAVGKAADLQKWRRENVSFVLGIDIAGESIRNVSDGAYRRYMDTLVTARGAKVPTMIFAIGDSSKSITDGKAGATEEEADMMRSVFGRMAPVGPVPPLVQKAGFSKLKDGADCMSCMFALHYFFESKDSFAGFLDNVKNCVRVGGYFIAPFFDGEKVFELLKDIEMGESKTGVEEGALLWEITKQYENDELPTDDSAFGLPIDVFFITIGIVQREYLVPFKLLKEKMRTIGCEVVNTATFDESYLAAEKEKRKFPMSDVVKKYSFLNRWCIFQRKSELMLEESKEGEFSPRTPQFAPRTPDFSNVPAGLPPSGAKATDALVQASQGKGPVVRPLPPDAIPVEGVPGAYSLPVVPFEESKEETRGPVSKEQGTYAVTDIFQFYPDAALLDKLKINDKGSTRWLAPYAPFPIMDGDVRYPSLEHYIAGMKYKLATDQPQLAPSIFGSEGTIHQKFVRQELIMSQGGKKQLSEEERQPLLLEEMKEVKNALRPGNIKKYRAIFDETTWAKVKDDILKQGLTQRWEKDARFRKIVEAARTQKKYLLFYTGPTGTNDLGGVRRPDGKIEGENKVGKMIMELSGYPQ